MFWKLDALQTFIRDLHWPEEEFGKHLEQRLKLMASDMIESCVKRWVPMSEPGMFLTRAHRMQSLKFHLKTGIHPIAVNCGLS